MNFLDGSGIEPDSNVDGWISWHGEPDIRGLPPDLELETLVLVMFAGELEEDVEALEEATEAGGWIWDHRGNSGDITAYRIVEPWRS